MTAQERWLIVVVASLVLFGSAARRFRPAPVPGETPAAEAPITPGGAAPDTARVGEAQSDGAGPVDLNRCEAAELERLPGLGPVKARRVIEWRETHGPFETVEDLTKVRGIGPKTLGRLRSRLTVSAEAGGGAAETRGPDAGEKREDHER